MTAAGITAAVTAALLGVGVSMWCAVMDGAGIAGSLLNTAAVIAFTAVGAVIAGARPDNRVGWLMCAGGVTWALGGAGVDLAHHGVVATPGSVAGAAFFAIAGSAVRSVGWYLITLVVPAYFPDGRLAGRRLRWLGPVMVVILVGGVVDPITDKQADLTNLGHWQNPIAPEGAWRAISAVAFLSHVPLSLVATVGVIAGLVSRWRRGDAFQRQQLTFFAVAAALPVIAVPIAFTTDAGWIFDASAVPLPFAIGFAVLARGLYDLRTAANRTLVWVTLSVVVAAAYALVIVGVGAVLHVDHEAPWLPWVAAGVVAVSFAPLRDGLQRGVNRLTFGRWDEPYDVLAALGQRVQATADADHLLDDVVTELHVLGLRDVAISDVDGRLVAGAPAPSDDDVVVPLSAYGTVVGTLRYRLPDTPLRARDRQLLDDLAGHLGGVLHAHRLTGDLQAARERLVLAREEERRRLRRDLHDGLGPALAGHVLRLDILSRKVAHDEPAAAEVQALRDELRGTVLEVRRVVEGLRPPALDELGLSGALAQAVQRLTAGGGVTADLEVGELPPLPAAVEVAAYRIVTEGVTNVVRHASASSCRVAVTAQHAALRVEVTDDGRGVVDGAPVVGGNGLQTMRERAEELRGRLQVRSGTKGTTVVAELPVPPAQRRPSGARRTSAPVGGA